MMVMKLSKKECLGEMDWLQFNHFKNFIIDCNLGVVVYIDDDDKRVYVEAGGNSASKKIVTVCYLFDGFKEGWKCKI